MASRGIDANIEREILRKSAEGSSCREIAEWLFAKHQIKKSRESISRIVSLHRRDLGEASKAIVREVIAPGLKGAMRHFERVSKEAERRSKKKGLKPSEWCRFATTELEAARLLLHFAGADIPDVAETEADTGARERLASRLGSLVARGPASKVPQ